MKRRELLSGLLTLWEELFILSTRACKRHKRLLKRLIDCLDETINKLEDMEHGIY